MKKTLFLVIPCYNEEQVLPETSKRLVQKLKSLMDSEKISAESKILFVDDGSKDKTWETIKNLNSSDKIFHGLKLSRNRGHQNALLAGLMEARLKADAVISLDADLQDDIDVIDKFTDEFLNGCDVVYGVRSKRDKDSFFKRTTAQNFYRLMKIMGVDIVFNHADYRLLSRKALDALSDFSETNLFLRGIVPLIGLKSSVVKYERLERFAGETKYPLKKMLYLAFDGITSFSVKPIRLILLLGVAIFTVSAIFIIYFFIIHLTGKTVEGWTTIVCSLWMIGGIQLLCLGVIGEYIGKIYSETKRRPLFIIEENTLDSM